MHPAPVLLIFAALSGALAVALGAFASHGAEPEAKSLLTTGGHYQLAHAVLAAAIALNSTTRLARTAGWLASAGSLIFSLSLASIALMGLRFMGAVAPIGGSLMIAAWLLLALAAWRNPVARNRPPEAQ